MNLLKNKKKRIIRICIWGLVVGLIMLLAGIIVWPFVSPIKVTWSSLPYEYTIHGTYIELNNYTGNEENVVIPEKICFRPVKVLGNRFSIYTEGMFKENETIKSVYIPDSVEVIEVKSFAFCRNLEEIHLPKNLKVLKEQTFDTCTSLNNIKIPEGVEKIGEGVFYCCNKLQSVVLPKSLKEIGSLAFGSCAELEDIEIPESVEEIGGKAFKETPWLEKLTEEFVIAGKNVLIHYNGSDEIVEVPEGIEYIGVNVFEERDELTKLILPKSLKKCASSMTYHCDNLEYVVIKNPYMELPDIYYEDELNAFNHSSPNLTIIGEKGSTAETYAISRGHAFLEIMPEE